MQLNRILRVLCLLSLHANLVAIVPRLAGGEARISVWLLVGLAVLYDAKGALRQMPGVYWLGVVYLISFLGFGFLGNWGPAQMTLAESAMFLGKPVLSIALAPLVIRSLAGNDQEMPLRSFIFVCLASVPICILQFVLSERLSWMTSEGGRAAGFWVNPNSCGLALCIAICMVPMIYKNWERQAVAASVMLGFGAMLTFSKAAIACCVALFVSRILRSASSRTGIIGSLLTVLSLFFVFIGIIWMDRFVDLHDRRMEELVSATRLDFSGIKDTRSIAWQQSLEAIQSNGAVMGLGHGRMERIVRHGAGLGPHNQFLWVWGNSGMISLFAMLVWFAGVVWFAVERLEHSSSWIAALGVMFVGLWVSHSLLSDLWFGVLWGVMVSAPQRARSSTGVIAYGCRTGSAVSGKFRSIADYRGWRSRPPQ